MAYVKNWLHCVWGTKNRTPNIIAEQKSEILSHIKSNAKSKGIYIDSINGHHDHIHCLISLNPDQSLSKAIQLIKGESSYWINKNKITRGKFEWADEYFGISVSESELSRVREYIWHQEEHHRSITWEEEYNEFITEYNLLKNQG